MPQHATSWGRWPQYEASAEVSFSDRFASLPSPAQSSLLAYGNGRRYGDPTIFILVLATRDRECKMKRLLIVGDLGDCRSNGPRIRQARRCTLSGGTINAAAASDCRRFANERRQSSSQVRANCCRFRDHRAAMNDGRYFSRGIDRKVFRRLVFHLLEIHHLDLVGALASSSIQCTIRDSGLW
jgi:hypothetical protein